MSRRVTHPDECPRCEYVFADAPDLERHLMEDHLMDAVRAKRESTATENGNGHGLPVLPATAEHVCECGRKIGCDLMMAMQMDAHAKHLKRVATKVKERVQRRISPGPLRANPEWTTEDARKLLDDGLSYREVGRQLQAHGATVKRAVVNGKV